MGMTETINWRLVIGGRHNWLHLCVPEMASQDETALPRDRSSVANPCSGRMVHWTICDCRLAHGAPGR